MDRDQIAESSKVRIQDDLSALAKYFEKYDRTQDAEKIRRLANEIDELHKPSSH